MVQLIGMVMTPFPYSIDVEAPLDEARHMMQTHRVRHLPVKEGNDLVGLITDRDIKWVLGPYLAPSEGDRPPRVRDACLFDVYIAEMSTPLREVAAHMARHRIGSVMVTKEGRLAGIFTATDACRCLAEWLGASSEDGPQDGDAA